MANCLAAAGSPQLSEERALSEENAFYIGTKSLLEVVRGFQPHCLLCYLVSWKPASDTVSLRLYIV